MRRVAIVLWVLLPSALFAHPVPRDQYDQTVVVRFMAGDKPGTIRMQIDFRLEVDPQTIVLKDMRPFRDEVDLSKISRFSDYLGEFTRIYADIYGRNFFTRVNGAELKWTCVRRQHTLEDEAGKPLDHLRCDFVYQASFTVAPGEMNKFVLRDLNYQEHPGKVLLSFVNESLVTLHGLDAPDAKLQELPFEKRGPDEEQALRSIRLRFDTPPAPVVAAPPPPKKEPEPPRVAVAPKSDAEKEEDEHSISLLHVFLRTDYGLALMLLIAAGIGAVHALTPGHGKTMVAAYLVGERGTVWHAVFLGLVTTLTHTGVVLIIAAVLYFLPDGMSEDMRRSIQMGLGLTMGLAITCLGLFLLLQRLAGRADHFHLGGGHHHHHHHHDGHHHHDHYHGHGAEKHAGTPGNDPSQHAMMAESAVTGIQPARPTAHEPAAAESAPVVPRRFGWWALTVLGISGGLIPCWDAIALLVLAVGMNLFWLALPVLLAFSAGLAAVLVLIGIAVVKFRGLLGSGEGRVICALPILSAIVVTLMGFWICYEAVNGKGL